MPVSSPPTTCPRSTANTPMRHATWMRHFRHSSKAWRGAAFASLFPPLALSIVLALIVFNKVGSPQFVTWLIAPLALGLVIDRRRWMLPALGALLTALLTQIVYPIVYDLVITAVPIAVAVLTVRNLLFVALFAWALARLARVPHRVRHPEPVQG